MKLIMAIDDGSTLDVSQVWWQYESAQGVRWATQFQDVDQWPPRFEHEKHFSGFTIENDGSLFAIVDTAAGPKRINVGEWLVSMDDTHPQDVFRQRPTLFKIYFDNDFEAAFQLK